MSRIGKSQFVKITVMRFGKAIRAVGVLHEDRITYIADNGVVEMLGSRDSMRENIHWIRGWRRRGDVDALVAAHALADVPSVATGAHGATGWACVAGSLSVTGATGVKIRIGDHTKGEP